MICLDVPLQVCFTATVFWKQGLKRIQHICFASSWHMLVHNKFKARNKCRMRILFLSCVIMLREGELILKKETMEVAYVQNDFRLWRKQFLVKLLKIKTQEVRPNSWICLWIKAATRCWLVALLTQCAFFSFGDFGLFHLKDCCLDSGS